MERIRRGMGEKWNEVWVEEGRKEKGKKIKEGKRDLKGGKRRKMEEINEIRKKK